MSEITLGELTIFGEDSKLDSLLGNQRTFSLANQRYWPVSIGIRLNPLSLIALVEEDTIFVISRAWDEAEKFASLQPDSNPELPTILSGDLFVELRGT